MSKIKKAILRIEIIERRTHSPQSIEDTLSALLSIEKSEIQNEYQKLISEGRVPADPRGYHTSKLIKITWRVDELEWWINHLSWDELNRVAFLLWNVYRVLSFLSLLIALSLFYIPIIMVIICVVMFITQ